MWTFCDEKGGTLDEQNLHRAWDRLRRRAQKDGVRPLKLHAARHERSGNQGIGDDIKHLGGTISRIVSRPVSAIVRPMRGPREEE